jgi:hypothetical protein
VLLSAIDKRGGGAAACPACGELMQLAVAGQEADPVILVVAARLAAVAVLAEIVDLTVDSATLQLPHPRHAGSYNKETI